MKRKIDDLGRLTIMKEYRKELDIENGDEVEVELKDNQLIITNPKIKSIKSKQEILEKIDCLKAEYDFGDNYLVDGYIAGLEWVINDDSIDVLNASNNK